MDWKKTALICFIILIAGAALTMLIFSTEPTATRVGATKETAMLVEVTDIERGSFRPTIIAMGTVEPAQDITLSPRVSGEIIAHSPAFTPGGFVQKGETLLQIDPADFENRLQQRQSTLRQAIADLNVEMGRQDVARKDFQLLDESLSPENEALVLRKPQLDAARATVESARAAVEQAKLELQRTGIKAPFDAHILSRNVNVGSQVAPGDNLGRLVGLDTYWVATTVPLAKLRWLSFPDASSGETGSEVLIRNRGAWPEGEYRRGSLYKLVGALESQTRMARVLVSVPDPLAYRTDSTRVPALMIGAFMEARIRGREISDVIRLSRDYIRKDDTVWIMENETLRIRDVNIIFRDAEYAYIADGLNDDDLVVTTNLTTVVDGARLRRADAETNAMPDSLTNATRQNPDETRSSGGTR